MKIGFFTDSYLPRLDGIAISVDVFRRGLEALGHEVYVICPDRPGAKKTDRRVIYIPSFPGLVYEGYRNSFIVDPLLVRKIQKLNLDIIHAHTPTQIGLLGCFIANKSKIPVVATCHSDEKLTEHYAWLKHLFGALHGATKLALGRTKDTGTSETARFYNLFDGVVAPSEKVEKYLKDGGARSVYTIPTGVEDEFFSDKIIRSDKQVRFVSTSRLVSEKRIDVIIDAFLSIKSDNARLTIVGDGPCNEQLQKQARKDSRIVFTGRLDRTALRECLQESDILVNACIAETQGLVFNEAAAVGLPSIYSDYGINPLLIDSETGLQTDGSSGDISRAMSKYLHNPKLINMHGKSAKNHAKHMTYLAQARKLEQMYGDVIS